MKKTVAALLLATAALFSCSTYNETVQPIQLPQYQSDKVEVAGAYITATAYTDPEFAEERFGFDIRGAGVLPVQVVIQNQGNHTLFIDSSQTFLIDRAGRAWPVLSFKQLYTRVKDEVELGETAKGAAKPSILGATAGAIIGAAIGILSDENVGESAGKGAAVGAAAGAVLGGAGSYFNVEEEVKEGLAQKTLRNRVIEPGELVHGFIFFPGGDKEARDASVLRLALRIDKDRKLKVVEIPLPQLK